MAASLLSPVSPFLFVSSMFFAASAVLLISMTPGF